MIKDLRSALVCSLLTVLLVCCSCTAQRGLQLSDVARLPQKASFYAQQQELRLKAKPEERARLKQAFLKRYFRPWRVNQPLHSRKKLFWPLHSKQTMQLFGEHTLPRSQHWLASLTLQADLEAFPALNQSGITLTNTNLRAMPTQKPAFHDFREAGEGYPFDYFQNSALWANTPVHIVHTSSNRDWLLVETDWVFGWVPSRDIGRVDERFMNTFQSHDLIAFVQDQVPVLDEQGLFRFTGHIGGLLPCVGTHDETAEVFVAVSDVNQQAVLKTARIEPGFWKLFPIPRNSQNLSLLADELLGQIYGWGGLYENRDCSALIRDFFTPFALWLPRNSSQQARQGRVIPLGHLEPAQKKRCILHKAIPFLTLIWMPGHVMLYIGSFQGQPLVLHAMWGLKTWSPFRGEGRLLVGRSVITSLNPGRDLPACLFIQADLIDRVQGMSILSEP